MKMMGLKKIIAGNLHHLAKGAIYFLVCVVVLFTFLSNWSLLDGMPRNSLAKMLAGSADKPFVYRLLLPKLVGAVEPVLPGVISNVLADNIAPLFQRQFASNFVDRFKYDEPGLRSRASKDWSEKSYRVKYMLIVILMFLSLCATLILLSRIASTLGASKSAILWGPVIYVLLLPLTFLNGGYYYDFAEQFFVSCLLLTLLTGNWFGFVLVAIVGQLNKETMLMLPFFLMPLIAKKIELPRAILVASFTTIACFLIYWVVKANFDSNSGMTMEYNLTSNLAFWSDLASYTRLADMYAIGIPLPRVSFCLVVIAAVVLGRHAPRSIIFSCSIALGVLVPMFFVFGHYDEFRSIGSAFPFLYLLALSSKIQSRSQQ
jgi:hypothetical protein